jgi:O-succinylbenzoic acid--CoA ligase
MPPKILLAEQNPVRFLAAFLAAVAANCPVFLCNPNWVEQEWQQVFELVEPDLIFGQPTTGQFPPHCPLPIAHCPLPNQIMIPTGGSSGKIRFAMHTWETLLASVRGFHQYFGEKPINSFCVLPLYHVSGLMQFLRSFTTRGRMVILPFKALVEGEGCHIDPTDFFISLVPTQLARLISPNSSITPPLKRGIGGDRNEDISPTAAWLSRFRAVLLGGAPAWTNLLEQARHYSIPLALTYGMTETASQIVTLKPEDFLSGNNSCGQVLPHAQITIRDSTGKILDANQTGVITIQADSLALGYYPEQGWGDGMMGRWGDGENFPNPKSKLRWKRTKGATQNLKSDDLGFFDEQGYLTILGRDSNKIITGGENVFPAEVEAAIFATQLVADVCVSGLPDRYWGQVVTAVYVPSSPEVSPALLQAAIADKLSKFKHPKYWIPAERLPRNAQGKMNYEQLKNVAIQSLSVKLV